ncbi:hypothetical protein OOU_Y34scaffold01154g1 [Pyricularia oryzae Y34]|uniref:Uncharacterized protein n=1 Tax=Pyricularia oryzae (strain Y34) TaxID=1143189 RepID=A0AA97PF98_PYRO3|nr:hypothetical protein OOU_Y34scaffold01154g1 [Pyricularia oryzae Y34]
MSITRLGSTTSSLASVTVATGSFSSSVSDGFCVSEASWDSAEVGSSPTTVFGMGLSLVEASNALMKTLPVARALGHSQVEVRKKFIARIFEIFGALAGEESPVTPDQRTINRLQVTASSGGSLIASSRVPAARNSCPDLPVANIVVFDGHSKLTQYQLGGQSFQGAEHKKRRTYLYRERSPKHSIQVDSKAGTVSYKSAIIEYEE